jgi:succinylglutamate desuccinylase
MNKTDLINKFEAAIKAVTDSGLMRSKTWAEGIWQLRPAQGSVVARFIISLVVHGDETGPLQLVLNLLAAWQQLGASPPVELTLVLGNLEAWALNKRYVEQDMNRLFAAHAPQASTTDARRALVLRQTLEKMRLQQLASPSIPLIHLDLHSTIRPSLKPAFAMVPTPAPAAPDAAWMSWLAHHSGLDALVLCPDQASTFSAYTARHGAWSCTVELGQVGVAAAHSSHPQALEPVFAQALADLVLGPPWIGGLGAHEKTPGRSQVFSSPLGGLARSDRSGGAHEKTLGRSQVFSSPLGGLARSDRSGGAHEKTLGRSQVFSSPLGGLARSDRSGGALMAPTKSPPRPPAEIFRVTHEVIRSSDTFELLLPLESCNFSPLEPGQLVARDAQTEIRAQLPGTCALFPNPHVAVGLRAALLIAPLDWC